MLSSAHSTILLRKYFLLVLLLFPLAVNAQKFSRPESYTCRIETAYLNDSLLRKNKPFLHLFDSDRFFSVELETGRITGNWVTNRKALLTKILNKNDESWNYRVISIVKGDNREWAINLHIEDTTYDKRFDKGIPFSGVTIDYWIGGFCH